MSSQLKRSTLAIFVLLMLGGVAIWLGAFLLETGKKPSKPESKPAVAEKQMEDSAAIAITNRSEAPAAPAPTANAPAGDDRISAILSNPNLDFPSAVNRLLEILPSLNETDQEEAAHHIANLSDDDQTAKWAAMLVKNQLPPPAAEVLFNDLLNRPQELNMPVLAAMADQTAHPKNKESVEILETLYGTPDQGVKWSAWVKAKMAEEAK